MRSGWYNIYIKAKGENTMKNLYEVKIATVTYDSGAFNGYKHIAWVLSEKKAREIAEKKKDEIKSGEYWWITVSKDLNGDPEVIVEMVGEVIE